MRLINVPAGGVVVDKFIDGNHDRISSQSEEIASLKGVLKEIMMHTKEAKTIFSS